MTYNKTYRKNCFIKRKKKKKNPANLIINRLFYKHKHNLPQSFLPNSSFLPPPLLLLLLFFSLVQKHLHGRYCVYNRSRTRFQNAGNYSEIDGLTMSVPVARRPLCQVREVFNNYEGSPSSAIHHRHRHRIFENGRISEQDIRVPTMPVIQNKGGAYL